MGKTLWLEQLKAMGLTVALSVGATVVIGLGLKAVLGLRPALDAEEEGLDLTDHGEAGYHPDEGGAHGSPEIEEGLQVLPPAATTGFQHGERV